MTHKKQTTRYVIIGAVIMAVVFIGLFAQRLYLTQDQTSPLSIPGVVILPEPHFVEGVPLTDTHRQPFTMDNFHGTWNILFFGFTHCPDICPTTLGEMSTMGKKLRTTPFHSDTRFFMVSVDPARDTPTRLQDYLARFTTPITGLTGDFLHLHQFARQFQVAFHKKPLMDKEAEYDVGHSAHIALVDPQGHYRALFTPPIHSAQLFTRYLRTRNLLGVQ